MFWQLVHFTLTRVPFFVPLTLMGAVGAQPLSTPTPWDP